TQPRWSRIRIKGTAKPAVATPLRRRLCLLESYEGGQAMQFRNYYRCEPCGFEWTDVSSAQSDDDCRHCGACHMPPYKSEDVTEAPPSLVEIEDALSGALSDLEGWADAGPEGMSSGERTRFERYMRVLERLSGTTPCKSENVEES